MTTTPTESIANEVATTDGSLLEQLLSETHVNPADEAYDITRHGLQALVSQLVESESQVARVDKSVIDHLIADIDAKTTLTLALQESPQSRQANLLLRHSEYRL